MTTFVTRSRDETIALGRSFASSLKPGDVVALFGRLGSGKTQFVTGVCRGLGVTAHVGSPTFTLINEYPARGTTVVHIDLYRISGRPELAELGIEEYLGKEAVTLIEWAEPVLDLLPPSHFEVKLEYGGGDFERVISIHERAGVAA